MYRFRKPKHLIEYSELENQEIYFSDLSSLNDPMEGFRQYYWKGDKIVWKNFFKHYILCLEQTILITRVSEPNHNFSFDDIPVFTNFNILPTPKYKEIIKELYDSVFSTAKIEEFISIISHKDLYASKDEVYFYLRTFHLVSLNAITKIHIKHGFRKKQKMSHQI